MEKVSITSKNRNLSSCLMLIIQGELRNWGYEVGEIQSECDSWGDSLITLEVKENE